MGNRGRRRRRTVAKAVAPASLAEPRARTAPRAVSPLSRSSWLALVLIVLVTIAAFAPALRAPFAFDDTPSIPDNPTVRHVFPLTTSLNPPPRLTVSGRPLVNLSLAVDVVLSDALGIDSGANSRDAFATVVFHATNVLIHIVCGLLLFGVVRRTLLLETLGEWANANADLLALVTTALWLLHPIQTEAVDYVVQRTELLVSAFCLATLYASIRAWEASAPRHRAAWLVGGVAASALGMASKEVMAAAPFLVVAYDRAFRAPSLRALLADRSRRWFYAGLGATLIGLAALIAEGARSDSVGFSLGLPWYRYLYSQGWAIAHYLQLLGWPRDLRFDYGLRPVTGIGGFVGGAIVLAIAIALLVVAIRAKREWLAFLVFWFFAILAPSSSIVPINTEIAAERRVYLASAAVIAGVVIAAAYALRRRRRTLVAASSVIAAALLVVSARRSALYADPEALWRDALAKAPDNPRAYDNLASVIYAKDRGRVNEADSLWNHAIRVDSTYMVAWSNLAQIRVDFGRTADARALLEHALRINPDYVDATRRLGGLLATQGDTTSIVYLERLGSSTAATDQTFVALAQAYLDAKHPDAAMAALRRALVLNPRRADAAAFLGVMLAQSGATSEALSYLESAVANGDTNPMTAAVLSVCYARAHRADQAINAARRAANLGGGNEQIFLTLARAMEDLGDLAEAETDFTRASTLAPQDPEPMTRLGLVKAARGDIAGAVALFRRALQVSPGYPPAVQALSKAGGK